MFEQLYNIDIKTYLETYESKNLRTMQMCYTIRVCVCVIYSRLYKISHLKTEYSSSNVINR